MKATDPLPTPFELPPVPLTGDYSLRVVRSGRTATGDHFYVAHDGIAVRLATEEEIKLWSKVMDAQVAFENLLHKNGNESRYV